MTSTPIDPNWVVAKLPVELKHAVKNHTFISQMKDEYRTDDLDTIARRFKKFDKLMLQGCWLSTLLDFGVCISIPFHLAALARDITLIRRLSRLGYDINVVDHFGTNAVHHFIAERSDTPQSHDMAVLRTLCEEGADVTSKPEDESIIAVFFERTGWRTPTKLTPLYLEGLNILLKYGASTSTVLHAVASCPSFTSFIQVLLEAGADIEEVVGDRTPLAWAAFHKNAMAVKALVDAGADVEGSGYELPLFAAIDCSDLYSSQELLETVKILCDAGADTKKVDDDDRSVLSYAMLQNGNIINLCGLVETLCKGGADVNLRHSELDFPGFVSEIDDTPLHHATSMGLTDCMKVLISYGADVNSQNGAGRTPLHIAVKMVDIVLVEILVKHGARMDVKDEDGETALMIAESMDPEFKDVVDFLVNRQE